MQKREYQSKYTDDGKCTEAQYLVDIAMERIAKREKDILPKRYWSLDKWKKHFRRQIVAANALLKLHTCKQVVGALNTPRGKNIYSLGLKKPISEIIQTQKVMSEVLEESTSTKDLPDANWEDDWDDDTNIFTGPQLTPHRKNKSEWEKLQ